MGITQAASLSGWFETGMFAGKFGNAIGSGLVGGTASVAAGGDFATGAVQGAMSRFLNDRRHDQLTKERINKMSPSDVVKYWSGGEGGHIDFGPDSMMSKIFSGGDGAQYFELKVLEKWGAQPPAGEIMDNFSYTFTWGRALSTSNLAEQVVGSWNNGTAISDGSTINYKIENRMGANSLMFGRQLQQYFGIETVGKSNRDLTMSISWKRGY